MHEDTPLIHRFGAWFRSKPMWAKITIAILAFMALRSYLCAVFPSLNAAVGNKSPASSVSRSLKAILLFLMCGFASSRAEYFVCDSTAVYDGDTFRCFHDKTVTKIRLSIVDAPERYQTQGLESKIALERILTFHPITVYPKNTDPYGRTVAVVTVKEFYYIPAAKALNSKHLEDSNLKALELDYMAFQDKLGIKDNKTRVANFRRFVNLQESHDTVQNILVENGNAIVYDRYCTRPWKTFCAELHALQAKAEAKKLGFFSGDNCTPQEFRESKRR